MSTLTCLDNPIGDIAVDPTSGALIATHPRDCTISVLDAADPTAVAVVGLDGDPVAVVVRGGRAYVATTLASYDAVSVLDVDTASVLSTHPLEFSLTDIAVSPDGAHIFAARTGRLGADIAVVEVSTADIASIPIAEAGPSTIDVIRAGADGQLYAGVCSHRDGALVVVDTARQRVVATVPVGAPIRDITLSPDGASVYVLAFHPRGAAAVVRIDLARSVIGAVIEVSESAAQVAMGPDGAEIYVMESDGIAVICPMGDRVFEHIALDARPSCIATSSATCRLYIADHAGGVTALRASSPVLQAAAS